MDHHIPIHTKHIEHSMKTFHEMERELENDETQQKIQNARRQAAYDMRYADWANESIRVMASYTVLLAIVFLSLLLIHMFGDSISQSFSSTFQSLKGFIPGNNNVTV